MQSDNSMFRIPVDMTPRAEESATTTQPAPVAQSAVEQTTSVAQSAIVAEKPLQPTLDSSPVPIENKATTEPVKVEAPSKTVVDIYAELSAISEEVMACRNAVLSKA